MGKVFRMNEQEKEEDDRLMRAGFWVCDKGGYHREGFVMARICPTRTQAIEFLDKLEAKIGVKVETHAIEARAETNV